MSYKDRWGARTRTHAVRCHVYLCELGQVLGGQLRQGDTQRSLTPPFAGEARGNPTLLVSGVQKPAGGGQVDLDSSLGPGADPQGPGVQGSLYPLSVWAWQRCTRASPVAPALVLTLQTAGCPTPSFRGRGVAAQGTGRLRLSELSWDLCLHVPRAHLPWN